jgi:peptidoglycan/xylan/chitin deacetylase (PgdA/CDA1 family)
MTDRGIFTISIDLELAWGVCDKSIPPSLRASLLRERDIVQRLLDTFAKYDIRATWALVGHLLLSGCEWERGRVHPEITRPVVKNHRRDWFFQHPTAQDDPLWYAKDIIENVRKSSPAQELASHSFCHMPYDETTSHRAAVVGDIDRAKELHNAWGLPFDVFVFPRNKVGYRELLAAAGIRVYRGHTHRWYYSIPMRSVRRLCNLLYFFLPLCPPTVNATVDEYGMINVPDSMLLFSPVGLGKLVSPANVLRNAIKGLERAVERREIFHLWFHPANFAHQTDAQFAVLDGILKHARRLVGSRQLRILPMGDISKSVPSSHAHSNVELPVHQT